MQHKGIPSQSLNLQNDVSFLFLQPKAPSPAPPAATSPLNINTKESAASHGSSVSTPPITPPTAAAVAAPTASSSPSPSVLSVMPVVQSGPAVAAPPAASVSMKEVVDSIAVSHTAQPPATSTPVNNFTIHKNANSTQGFSLIFSSFQYCNSKT